MNVVFITHALNNEKLYSIDLINSIIEGYKQDLERGTDFTGKPSTNIYADKNHVVKIKTYNGHSEKATRKWIEKRRSLEIDLAIYPGDKTWFLIDINGEIFPGNICSRLLPLHQIDNSSLPHGFSDITQLVSLSYDLTLKVASEHHKMLDMGLSNFALDRDGNLTYVDDDIYKWDRFLTFAQMISAHIREQRGGAYNIRPFAESIKLLILKYFEDDNNWLFVVDEHVKNTFIPSSLSADFHILSEVLRASDYSGATPQGNLCDVKGMVAIMGDIHGNLLALKSVLDDMKSLNIEQAIVVGDIVGYGPKPNECVELLKSHNFHIIKGNHDHAAGTGRASKGFSKSAKWAIEWAINELTEENKKWLRNLLPVIKTEAFWVVHGAPRDPTFFNAYVYETTYSKNLEFMAESNLPLCFHGHTHTPGVYIRTDKNQDYFDSSVNISVSSKLKHILFSPGSVGQPRNKSSAAQYAIWDSDNNTFSMREVSYDMGRVVQDMKELEFPDYVRIHLEKLLPAPRRL